MNNTTDITYLLTYDDSDVDLLKAGSYEVILSVEYLEKIYETTLTITVNEREWIVNFIPQQNYTVYEGDEAPNYTQDVFCLCE